MNPSSMHGNQCNYTLYIEKLTLFLHFRDIIFHLSDFGLVPSNQSPNTMETPSTDQPSVLLSGYLLKKGHFVKSWKKRWFVLDTSAVLSYYKKKEDKTPVGRIILDNASLFIKLDQLGVMVEVPTNSQSF